MSFFNGRKGIYKPADLNKVSLKGNNDISPEKLFVIINFIPCTGSDCASHEEQKTFLANHNFVLTSRANYIDLEEVEPVENTLKSTIKFNLGKSIKLDEQSVIHLTMNEYRTELSDSMFNFMDLLEPQTVNYLNIGEIVEERPSNSGLF